MKFDRLWRLTDDLTAVCDAVERLDAKDDPVGDRTGHWRLEDIRRELPSNFEGDNERVQDLLGILVSHQVVAVAHGPDGPRWSDADAGDGDTAAETPRPQEGGIPSGADPKSKRHTT